MLIRIAYLLACLTTSALATPVAGSQLELNPRAISTPYLATFEDRAPVDILSDVINAPEIGAYSGLRWQGFYTIQPGILGFLYIGCLLPNSGTNAAGYDTLGSLDTNTPSIVRKLTIDSRVINQRPTLHLQSFWWGCSLGLKQHVLTVPTGCNLTIIGEYAFQEKTRRTIRFPAVLIQLVANMKFIDLGDQFKGLDTITFITQYDVGINGATSFDDFSYTINR